MGNATRRFVGSHKSPIEPPTVDSGDSPKKPAKKRHTSCPPNDLESPAPMRKSMYIASEPK